MVGVMAVLIALALMTGLQGELRDRLVGSAAHVYVLKAGGLKNPQEEVQRLLTVPHVIGAAPIVQGKAMLTSRDRGEGVHRSERRDPGAGRDRDADRAAMVSGSLDALNTRRVKRRRSSLGKDLAAQLHV